jgi:glycosyltransferase involved in cell wall biosynthesis
MHLGMPVVGLATTEAVEAVPAQCGLVSTNIDRLCAKLRQYAEAPEIARADGMRARSYARDRFGIERFLRDWDALLDEVTR